VEAVNLDGGGSSACAVRGAVANSPSEGVERPVADSLLVFADELMPPPGDSPLIAAPELPLRVGDVRVFDSPKHIDPRMVAWTTKGGVGFVDQEGVFRAQRPGKGSVVLWVGAQATEVPLTVVKGDIPRETPKLDSAGFLPQGIFSANGGTLTLTLPNSEGDKLGNEPIALAVTGGVATPNPVVTSPKGEATVTIQWDSATAPAARQIKLSSPNKRFESVIIRPN
jgi:hypothetical protein